MSDEKPVIINKRKQGALLPDSSLICIVHYEHSKYTEVRALSDSQFNTIRNALVVRQSQAEPCHRLDPICSAIPVEFDSACHGIHRWCYKNFTNVSRLTGRSVESHEEPVAVSSRMSSRSRFLCSKQHPSLFSQHQCIFCEKNRKYVRGSKNAEMLVKCETAAAEQTIKECAAAKQDYNLLGRIDDVDLREKKVRYHETCRRDYVRW